MNEMQLPTTMSKFGRLNKLFYEDYNNPDMPAVWSTNDHRSPRQITWSLVDKQILFGGRYEYANSSIYNYERQISYAFSLWDKALNSVQFRRTTQGNNADITLATSPNTMGNLALFIRKIPQGTGRIDAARIKLNHSNLLKHPRGIQTKVILHEIGNILGLGDIRCTSKIKSVMEDKCAPPEPFAGRNSLYDFDRDLIKHVYGELSRPQQYRRFAGTSGIDKIIGSSRDDRILGYGGADKINGKNGDDLIDPGYWTKGLDNIKGGKGSDTFVIKDGYWAFINDFKATEDKLDIAGLSRGLNWEVNGRHTYIYGDDGHEVAKFKGKIDLSVAEIA